MTQVRRKQRAEQGRQVVFFTRTFHYLVIQPLTSDKGPTNNDDFTFTRIIIHASIHFMNRWYLTHQFMRGTRFFFIYKQKKAKLHRQQTKFTSCSSSWRAHRPPHPPRRRL